MRKLAFICGVAVVIVAGVAIYAVSVLQKVEQRDKELRAVFAKHADALRAMDAAPAVKQLDPARFAVWMKVRTEIGTAFHARIEERDKSPFHARETHNEILAITHESLTKHKMSFAEYRAIDARWRALLARAEFKSLRDKWNATVHNRSHPRGLPLPDSASNATPAERKLIQANEAKLGDTLAADLLGPLFEAIEKNDFKR